jgi:hypothetical protein
MKRVGGLFDALTDRRLLGLAVWRAAQGKRQRPEVRRFLADQDAETARIIAELREGTYRFGEYRTFPIRDPKTRQIHAPPFRDRVVHHALVAVAGTVFERGAIPQSHACRIGHGQHAAMAAARGWIRPGDWFLKADIAKYYDSVDHTRLRQLLARRFRERRLLTIFDRLLDSHEAAPGRGLPIGALTSQYLGNFYLDPFDHWVKQTRRMPRYLRYMDDFLCFGAADELRGLRDDAAAVLEGLGLQIKQGGVLNRCEVGVPWLGFVLYPDRLRLNRLGRRRLRRRLKDLERGWERGTVDDGALQARSEALFAHARTGDDLAWRRMVSRFSRFGETQGPQPRDPRRHVEQLREELPLGVSQQEEAG